MSASTFYFNSVALITKTLDGQQTNWKLSRLTLSHRDRVTDSHRAGAQTTQCHRHDYDTPAVLFTKAVYLTIC